MKLNNKRTFLIGLAFMSICAFWQMYDFSIPLILRDTFRIGDTLSGVIMAADNVLALFLLPLLGSVSDRVDTKIGKRMPFIIYGTFSSVVLLSLLPVMDNLYASSPAEWIKFAFIFVLLVLLVAMASYRSPAVALMPDLTPKPLRSKANAIINLMGAIGGAFALLLIKVLYPKSKTQGASHIDYLPLMLIIAAFMLVSVIWLFFSIKEKRDNADVIAYDKAHPEECTEDDTGKKAALPKEVRKSLAFILTSIALWFMGYNAVSTAFSKFATQEWQMAEGDASTCLLIGTAGAMISYIPIGILSSRIGRKKTILSGCALLAACFAAVALLSLSKSIPTLVLYVIFVLVGFAWAAINVNSLPMVVEMCKGSDVGKFTGVYYTFSMAAQVVTPILSGFLLEYVGYWTLFPYAALFVAASFATMLFVSHGDNRPERRSALESFDVED